MSSNNNLKDQVLALFPDNNNFEITAQDMRLYIEAIFGDKEVVVIKIKQMSDLAFNNSRIYEGSLVVIYNDANPDRVGIYLSKVNQPAVETDLIQVTRIGQGTSFRGHWDASTNIPTLSDGIGVNGDYYIVSVAGTQDLGSGTIDFKVGDSIIYAGDTGKWEQIINSNAVDSVNGKTGTVVLNTDDIAEGVTNLYYTDARVDTYVNTMGFAKIDDSATGATSTTYSAQKIDSMVASATEVDDSVSTASTIKVWSINKINASYMPIDVDFGTYT